MRSILLSWMGVVGGTITLLGNIEQLIKLSHWSRVIVENWLSLTHFVWTKLFALFFLELPLWLVPFLTFCVFLLMATIASVGRSRGGLFVKWPALDRIRNILGIYASALAVSFAITNIVIRIRVGIDPDWGSNIVTAGAFWAVSYVLMERPQLSDWVIGTLSALFFAIMYFPTYGLGGNAFNPLGILLLGLIGVPSFIWVLSIAADQTLLARRLSLVALCFATVIVLSEISKMLV